MTDTAIRVENLSKRYRVGPREPYKARRDVLTDVFAAPFRRLREIRNSPFAMSLRLPSANCLPPCRPLTLHVSRFTGVVSRRSALRVPASPCPRVAVSRPPSPVNGQPFAICNEKIPLRQQRPALRREKKWVCNYIFLIP